MGGFRVQDLRPLRIDENPNLNFTYRISDYEQFISSPDYLNFKSACHGFPYYPAPPSHTLLQVPLLLSSISGGNAGGVERAVIAGPVSCIVTIYGFREFTQRALASRCVRWITGSIIRRVYK